MLEVSPCTATWPSGASKEFDISIPLVDFPKFAYAAVERPEDHPDSDRDYVAGFALLEEREYAVRSMEAHVAALVAGIGTAMEARNVSRGQAGGTFDMINAMPRQTANFAGTGGIQWDWVQPATSFTPQLRSAPFSKNFTPVFPAASCVGPIVMGVCRGAVTGLSKPQYCAGSFINGRCMGAILFGD